MMAVSIHPAPPADRLAPPRGLAGPLPVRRPQLAPLVPKKEKRERVEASACDCTETLN